MPRIPVLDDVLVTTSPLPGTSINVDQIPGNVKVLGAATLTVTSTLSLQTVNRYLGIYLTDPLEATPALALSASARYNVATVDPIDRRGRELTGYSRFEHVNAAIGATYRVRPTLAAYAGLAVNTRAPTASESECSHPLYPYLLPSSLASDCPTRRQVVARTIELGARRSAAQVGQSGYRFDWHGGLFKTRGDDDIYGVSTSVNSSYFRNVGARQRRGIELGASLETGRWSATATWMPRSSPRSFATRPRIRSSTRPETLRCVLATASSASRTTGCARRSIAS